MGKAQSKRSVDITTETKKGTEDEIIEKIENLDKKEVVNGDATISEKSDPEKKESEEVENDKDMTTEKEVDVQGSGDAAAEFQNVVETTKDDEGSSATAEEISPLADESIKKSKKEKVKKKWSFRSISFGKKDKQKPAKSEDAVEDGNAATNGAADTDEKTNDTEDTQKEKSVNDNEEKTKENHENGDSTPRELNGDEQNEEKHIDEKSNDITANTTKNINTTEPCEPVQNETAAVKSELSEKTESTAVIIETKISENATVDDAPKNANGVDEKTNATDQEPQKIDVTNTSIDTPSDKINSLASSVTNESSVTTNGEVVDQIHQNGDHGESEQDIVEKSKAQIEVNINTDKKVSAATLDYISSTSINPSNVQIHAQDLNASSEKPNEIVQINNDECITQNSTIAEVNCNNFDLSSHSVVVDGTVDAKSSLQIEATSNLTSETIDKENSPKEKVLIDPSPPPLPVSPPPSQVAVFAFTNNDESVEDSIPNKSCLLEMKDPNMAETNENPSARQLPPTESINNAAADKVTIFSEKSDESNISYEYDPDGENNKNLPISFQENQEIEVASICNDLHKDNEEPNTTDHIEESKISEGQVEEVPVAVVAAAVIDEITEIAAEIVNKQFICNEEQITHTLLVSDTNSESEQEGKIQIKKESEIVECNANEEQSDEYNIDKQEYVCDVIKTINEFRPVIKQTNNVTIECSLNFNTTDSIQQDQDGMNYLKMSDYLEEKHLDPAKEFALAKDIKDNVTVAEITKDLSVTCE